MNVFLSRLALLYPPAHKVTLQISDAWCKILKCTHPSPPAQCAGGSSPGCSPATQTAQKKHMMLFLFKGPDRRLLEQTGWRNTDKTWASLYFRSSPASTRLYNINAARQICKIFQHNSAGLSVCRTKCLQNSALLIEINGETVNLKLRIKIVCKW